MDDLKNTQLEMIWKNTKKKPRQEICALLKWFCFLLNFCIFVIGVTCLALGIYLCTKDPRTISEWVDFFLNPAIFITIIGFLICFISLCGLFGALRDNVFLLKTFAFCVFCTYILLVISTFVIFMLFFSDTAEGISTHSIFNYAIKKYHLNRNIADLVDYIQEQLECCGISSSAQGFRDWNLNEQFQCNQYNPYPERCGVPFSCCRKSVISEAASSSATNPLLPAMRSLQCWQNVQTKQESDLDNNIYTHGCLQPMRILFEKYAVYLAAVVAAIILPVCCGVCLSQCLARQINYQKYLLEREARREERRKRRERRYLEQKFNKKPTVLQNINPKILVINKPFTNSNQFILKKSPPPNFPPPPTPLEDADTVNLAAAIVASKQQYQKEKMLRQQNKNLFANLLPIDNQRNFIDKNKLNFQAVEKKDEKVLNELRRKTISNVHNVKNKKECAVEINKNIVFPSTPPIYNSQFYFLQQSDFT